MPRLLRALNLVAPVGQAKAPPTLGKPNLGQAPEVWHGTRGLLDHNIEVLKRAISAEYAREHPDVIAAIDNSVVKLDVILERLDHRLGEALARAHAASDQAARNSELKAAKTILSEYLVYVKSEPLIGQIDANPFGVQTRLRQVLSDSLTHLAQAVGR